MTETWTRDTLTINVLSLSVSCFPGYPPILSDQSLWITQFRCWDLLIFLFHGFFLRLFLSACCSMAALWWRRARAERGGGVLWWRGTGGRGWFALRACGGRGGRNRACCLDGSWVFLWAPWAGGREWGGGERRRRSGSGSGSGSWSGSWSGSESEGGCVLRGGRITLIAEAGL